ncbi:hypothetical protein ACH4TV_06030 [Streptomyces sp. NPDC020898]
MATSTTVTARRISPARISKGPFVPRLVYAGPVPYARRMVGGSDR